MRGCGRAASRAEARVRRWRGPRPGRAPRRLLQEGHDRDAAGIRPAAGRPGRRRRPGAARRNPSDARRGDRSARRRAASGRRRASRRGRRPCLPAPGCSWAGPGRRPGRRAAAGSGSRRMEAACARPDEASATAPAAPRPGGSAAGPRGCRLPSTLFGATGSRSPLPSTLSGGRPPPPLLAIQSRTASARCRESCRYRRRADRIGVADHQHGARLPLPDDLDHPAQRLGAPRASARPCRSRRARRSARSGWCPRGVSRSTTTLAPWTWKAPPRGTSTVRPSGVVTTAPFGSGGGWSIVTWPVARSWAAAARGRSTREQGLAGQGGTSATSWGHSPP